MYSKVIGKIRRLWLALVAPSRLSGCYSFNNVEYKDPDKSAIVVREEGWDDKCSVDLSVIVPAYNAGDYIQKCLNSVSKQVTQYKYEVIVVNDGSTDNTASIVETHFPDFRLINQVNMGHSGAKNTGISSAEGRYVTFLDSDDYLEPNAIESLLKVAFENDAEAVEGNYYEVHELSEERNAGYKWHADLQTNCSPVNEFRGYPWGRVYKRQVFSRIQFPENYWFEDTVCKMLIDPQLHGCCVIKDVVYDYLINPNGITEKSKNNIKSLDSFFISRKLLQDRMILGIAATEDDYLFFMNQVGMNYYRTRNLPEYIRRVLFIETVRVWENNFPPELRNGNYSNNNYVARLQDSFRENNYREYLRVVE